MTAEPISRPRTRVVALSTLIGSQLFCAASLLPWLVIAGLSFMAFDAPGSTANWEPWAFVAAVWSYPIWLALFALAAWLLFAKRRYVAAVAMTALPTLPGVALLTALLIGA